MMMSIHELRSISYIGLCICGFSIVSSMWMWFLFNIRKAIIITRKYDRSSTRERNIEFKKENDVDEQKTILLEERTEIIE